MDFRDVLAPSQEAEDEFEQDWEEVLEEALARACELLQEASRLMGFLSDPAFCKKIIPADLKQMRTQSRTIEEFLEQVEQLQKES
jgi:hypothetical protein